MALTGQLADGVARPENPDAIVDGYAKREPGPSQFGEVPDQDQLDQLEPAKAAKRLNEYWKEQDQIHQRPNAQYRVNVKRRDGHVNVQVVKAKDEDRYEEWSWGPAVPHDNKAATLCRKAAGNLCADPFVGEPLPASSDPEDVDDAEFSAQVLEEQMSESGLDDENRQREAFDMASNCGSVMRYFRVEPQGRRQPVQIEAHPQAVSSAQPFAIPIPRTNPLTGQPIPGPDGQPIVDQVPQPGPYTLRYVAEDGSLTDQRGQAKLEWVPKIVDELLPSPQWRFLPATATFIDKADALLIGCFRSIGELRRMVPKVFEGDPGDPEQGIDPTPKLTDEKIAAMCKYRPERPDDFLPGQGKIERAALDALKGDNRLAFVLTGYWRSGGRYPSGYYICCAGDEQLLHRRTWSAKMDDGSEESLEIPGAQYLQFREGKQTKDGTGFMEILGPGNEIRAGLLGSWFEHLDRFNSAKTFIPTNSIIKAADLENPTKLYLPINPTGKPEKEEVGEFPRSGVEVYDRAGDGMDHASGLEAAAQGLEDPSVQSGKHAQTIISQVHAGLSEPRNNIIRAEIRTCRIVLQLVRAYFTKPQQMTFEGKDGRFRQKRWNRADLGNTKDVRMKAATMTMMSPEAKLQFVNELVGAGILGPDVALELMSSGLSKTLGWKDDAHRLRIRRQLADWEEGPPPDWKPVEPQMQRQPDGSAALMPVPDPVLMAMWESVLADELPPVAEIRLTEIAKAMASTTYLRWPKPWRAAVDMEFQHMSGILQQQAQAQADAEAAAKGGGPGQGPPGGKKAA